MSARLDDTFAALLEDVDTAPEGKALDAAFDALTDWVQDNRAWLLTGLKELQREPPPPASAPEPPPVPPAGHGLRPFEQSDHVLRAFLAFLQKTEMMTYVPPAVSKRGTAYIPTPAPAFMSEATFLSLLEAEAQAAEDMGAEAEAAGLRQDIRRRKLAHEAQDRREAQLAALGPRGGRVPLARPATV